MIHLVSIYFFFSKYEALCFERSQRNNTLWFLSSAGQSLTLMMLHATWSSVHTHPFCFCSKSNDRFYPRTISVLFWHPAQNFYKASPFFCNEWKNNIKITFEQKCIDFFFFLCFLPIIPIHTSEIVSTHFVWHWLLAYCITKPYLAHVVTSHPSWRESKCKSRPEESDVTYMWCYIHGVAGHMTSDCGLAVLRHKVDLN